MIGNLIVLVGSAFCAAAVSGAAGFGGALLLLPLLVVTVGSERAVPLLTIAQLIGNASRVAFGFSHIQWRPVGLFLSGAIPLSIIGALCFVNIPKGLVSRCIGVAILLFVVLRYYGALQFKDSPSLLVFGGGAVGLLSGIVGSAGPLGAAVFLSLGLTPVAYVSSEASTAIAIHAVKTVVYGNYISLDRQFWFHSVLMGVAMVLGTWSAKGVIRRLPQEVFQRFVTVLLAIIAGYMAIHG